ncbi:hypothetical protein M426DRAFT_73216 [Hypoxylon sp. CI-4A]|nr:hypothetical protein M426DRAFT_73216 [Hypoxylon sp. CI-4A]
MPGLFGGSIAAIIHHAAATHAVTNPTLAAWDQPDIISMHVEYLRLCERSQSTIVVSPLKLGLSQNGQLKVVVLATTTNYDRPLRPTIPVAWTLLPPVAPVPDFDRVLAHQPDGHWLPARLSGEIIKATSWSLILNPRRGFPRPRRLRRLVRLLRRGRAHGDATYLAMMTDVIPSMSDTLLRNEGLYDAHAFLRKMERWAEKKPGVPAEITNSVAEAMQATLYNNTVFTRAATKMLHSRRMSINITMCNSEIELVLTAHQLILVLEAGRKFRSKKSEPVL